MEDNVKHHGSSPLFAIFVLSLMVLFLVPFTLYKLCGGDSAQTHKAWVKDGKKGKKTLAAQLKSSCTRGNILLLLMWLGVAGLMWYIQTSQKDIAPFDPFAIMKLSPDATDKEIRKQYRELAKITHPDKNLDDPKAAEKFDLLAKAYQALTDEVSKANWIKYGHPDGPQAMNIGVAMPSFLFNPDKDMAPFMLLGLVGFGILLPLVIAACYLTRSNKYAGPNQVQHETLGLWFQHPKFGIKESQGLRRIPDTLVVAKEFIDLPVPSEQAMALEDLKKLVIRSNADLKDLKKDFWKRKSSIVKVHMLLLAFMERAEGEIPEVLKADLKFLLERAPRLLAELMNVAVYPRRQVFLYGWMCPAIAVVEMMQCLTQAVPIRVRKPAPTTSSKADKGGEAMAALMQLPGMDMDATKKLSRKKVRNLADLAAMSVEERSDALCSSGFTSEQLADVETFMAAMPTVHAECSFHVDGHPNIMEGDMVTASVHVALTRPSHTGQGADFDVDKVKGVEAYAPCYPIPREEKWYFLLCDTPHNVLLAHANAMLMEAEKEGAVNSEKYLGVGSLLPKIKGKEPSKVDAAAYKVGIKITEKANGTIADDNEEANDGEEDSETTAMTKEGGGDEDLRQLVQLRFLAPPAGKYNFQLYIMSDCWIGCDKTITMPLVVEKLNRTEREARESMMYTKPFDDSDDSDDGEDDDEDGEDEGEPTDDDYDSEETGTDVSDDDVESMPDLVDPDEPVSQSGIPGMDSQCNIQKECKSTAG